MSDIEDEEMAAAIAASMEAFNQRNTRKNVIEDDRTEDEDTDAEDEFQADLRRALEASKAETRAESLNGTGSTSTTTNANPGPVITNPASEFLRQRALLEKERIARNKGQCNSIRMAAGTTAGPAGNGGVGSIGHKRSYSASQSDEDDDDFGGPPSKRKDGTNKAIGSSANETGKCEGELFYDHELRQTANRITEALDKRNGVKTFRITDIIGDKKELAFAILSSYSTDIAWLYSLFDHNTPVILVNQPQPDGEARIHNVVPNWIMTMPFMQGGFGAMHVKLMLLFYKTGRLRVAIPTANFIDYDWRDIENSVWVQDFPPLTKPVVGRDPTASAFSTTLQMVLTKLNVPNALNSLKLDHPNLPLTKVEELARGWKFGNAKVKLIPSMAGKYVGWDQVLKQGHIALMKGVIDIGAHTDQTKRKSRSGAVELVIECQGSSIGKYSKQWLQQIHSSCSGISPEKWLGKSAAARAQLPMPPIKILFPSLRTVQDSVLGEPGAGTMFCRRNIWTASTFPQALFHDSNSKRGKVLMHTKMILGLWRAKKNPLGTVATSMSKGKGKRNAPIEIDTEEEIEDDEDGDIQVIEPEAGGWLYVGSHNFTQAAWGNLTGSSFTPELNITNYELGVLITLSEKPKDAEKQGNALVSWVRPPRKYNLAPGGDEPWIQ